MTYKMYGAFVASLSVVALILAANETFGRSGAALGGVSGVAHGGGPAATHSTSHRSAARLLRHHRRNNVGALWPAAGGFFYDPWNGEPNVNATQPMSGDVHYTYTYDVPWDAVHRFPQAVTPSEIFVRPYVPGCPTQAVTVPGNDGKEQTVNIVRCY